MASRREDIDLLVYVLRQGLEPLVRDGLIDEARADERAGNMAAIVLGDFELRKLGD